MGFFDWLKKLFSKTEYDSKAALQFIKKNYQKYKIIDPEDRKEFEEMFLSLAKEDIHRLKKYLNEAEINILAQRIRIRQFQQKEKEGKKVIAKKGDEKDLQRWGQYKTQIFTKTIREVIRPSLSNLTKNIKEIEHLEAKYADAIERNIATIFVNSQREIGDIETEIKTNLAMLEKARKDLFSLYTDKEIEAKLTELINLWKTTLGLLQQARVTPKNNEKVKILGIINQSLRKEYTKKINSFLETATAQTERLVGSLAAK
ncbi:MAG: hypothetical protein Q8R18_01830 [bacterium]|nr:hypothetical protein [bacterium]